LTAHRRPKQPAGVYLPAGRSVQRYSTITLDPPWPYGDRINAKNRGAANHYGLMSIEALKALALPLQQIAEANSHLYLWTTNSFLEEAFVLMRAWGWAYKTTRTWVKPQIGMGHYYRNNTEHVLFGVRGRLPAGVRNLPTAFTAPRSHHSAKPETFYRDVQLMSPGAYIELFARQERAGWTTLGNELDGASIIDALRQLVAY
jgi:N6-adenosine-specific RNA methylase IME4